MVGTLLSATVEDTDFDADTYRRTLIAYLSSVDLILPAVMTLVGLQAYQIGRGRWAEIGFAILIKRGGMGLSGLIVLSKCEN